MTNTKQQTAVEWYDNEIGKLFDQFLMGKIKIYDFQNQRFKLEKQAKEMENEQSQAYAAFCVGCDRKKLPLLEFDGWVKLERGDK